MSTTLDLFRAREIMTPTSVTRLSLGYDLTVDDEGFITMRLKPRSTSTDGGHNTLASALGVNL